MIGLRTEKLGSLCQVLAGGTPSRSKSGYWNGGIPWVKISDMLQGDIRSTDESITQEGLENSAARLLPKGTLLLSIFATIGRTAVLEIEAATNQAIVGLIPRRSDEIDVGYLRRYLEAQVSSLVHQGRGGAQSNINNAILKNLDIPLPPLDEQKGIAVVLNKADGLRRQRQESLELTEKFLQSVFIDMFVRNPDAADWTRRSVDWMAQDAKGAIRTGPFGSQLLHSEFVDHGIAVLGIDNAVRNRFEWGQPRFITPEKYQGLKRYKVFPGDLIITIMGTLGRCAIVPDDIPEAINTKHLCCITLDHGKCLPEFLHAGFLNHPDVLHQLGVRTKGAVMPGLNMGIIKDLKLPLPPIELQREFKRVVNLCTSSRSVLEESKNGMDDLFGSFQQRAFRGELDLSRLKLDEEAETSAVTPEPPAAVIQGRYRHPGSFIAPPDIEAQMMALEYILDKQADASIQWSEDYFKYRMLSQVLQPPFSFADIWNAVEHDIEEPSYEIVKDKLFEYLGEGTLEQQFDPERKEIVFHPRT